MGYNELYEGVCSTEVHWNKTGADFDNCRKVLAEKSQAMVLVTFL